MVKKDAKIYTSPKREEITKNHYNAVDSLAQNLGSGSSTKRKTSHIILFLTYLAGENKWSSCNLILIYFLVSHKWS